MSLKTLKDLSKYKVGNMGDDGDPDIRFIQSNSGTAIFIEELRQEAIKWIKKCGCLTNWNSRDWQCCDGCKRFIDFFNITESDLK